MAAAEIAKVTVGVDTDALTADILAGIAKALREAADRLAGPQTAERLRDHDGDTWEPMADGLYHSPQNPGIGPYTREHIESVWGPIDLIV